MNATCCVVCVVRFATYFIRDDEGNVVPLGPSEDEELLPLEYYENMTDLSL